MQKEKERSFASITDDEIARQIKEIPKESEMTQKEMGDFVTDFMTSQNN